MDKIKITWQNDQEEKLNVKEKHGVTYLTWPALERFDFVRHGFTTRLGGVSEGMFTSMNLSFTRGDEEWAVRENYERIARAMGFETEDIVCSDQTHTTNVRVVTEADRGKGITHQQDYTDVDGLVTNVPGLVLATFYADCVPLYFVDPVHSAVGLSHSGWRGTVDNIARATLKTMEQAYKTNPADVTVAIGPSICQDCYEISEDVARQFEKAYPKEQYEKMMIDRGNGKFQLDLWEACRFNLEGCGVPSEQIFKPNLCTCCNPEFLFSHRASKGRRGNLAAFLQIRKEDENH